MKRLLEFCAVLLFVGLLGSCHKSKSGQAATCGIGDAARVCPAGTTCLDDNQCHQICLTSADCPTAMVCGNGGVCEDALAAPPTIASVDGDGSLNGASDQGQHFTNAGLIITGTGFTGAVVALGSGGNYQNLVVRAGATASRMEVDLPGAVAPGSYSLMVANALGSTEVVLPLIKGETGDDGVCNPTACTSRTFPGSGVVSTLVARGVNAAVSAEQSARLNGSELIAPPADGIWLSLLDRATHQVVQSTVSNQTYTVAAVTTLETNLATITEDQIAILVSRGDVSAMMGTLSLQLKRLGASDSVTGLGATEAFVLVGYPGMGEGNAALVISSTTMAEATVLVVDGQIVGPHTGTALGRTIGTAEIANGAITADKLAAGAVTQGQQTVMAGAPGLARTSSAGVTLTPGNFGELVVSASSIGTKNVYIPLPIPTQIFGTATRLVSVRVCYQTTNPANFIDGTHVRTVSDTLVGTTLITNTTDRTSTTAQCYTVSDATPVNPAGALNLYMPMSFAILSENIIIGGIEITLDQI